MPGGRGSFNRHHARLVGRHLLVIRRNDFHVKAGGRLGGRARLDGQKLDAPAVARDGPGGLGLPPMVDHRAPQQVGGPLVGVRVGALPGQVQGVETAQVVPFEVFALAVFAFDGPESGGRGEQHLYLVLVDHPPEGTGVRGAHRLTLEDDGGAAVDKGGVHDVGVAHHPAHIAGRPVNIAGLYVVDVFHGPVHGHRMSAVVAHNALG